MPVCFKSLQINRKREQATSLHCDIKKRHFMKSFLVYLATKTDISVSIETIVIPFSHNVITCSQLESGLLVAWLQLVS